MLEPRPEVKNSTTSHNEEVLSSLCRLRDLLVGSTALLIGFPSQQSVAAARSVVSRPVRSRTCLSMASRAEWPASSRSDAVRKRSKPVAYESVRELRRQRPHPAGL